VDYYDAEYRMQCHQERFERIRDDYRRAQRPPVDSHRGTRIIMRMRSIWAHVRQQVPQRAPVYRS